MKLPKIFTSFHLKVIAIVSMLIDHFAYIPFASILSTSYSAHTYTGMKQSFLLWISQHEQILWKMNEVMHWIGRLAFPLFCFLLVQGFMHTKNKTKYAFRLGLFALLSEIPYDMAFNGCIFSLKNNNVFFTLFTGFMMIWAISIEKKRYETKQNTVLYFGCIIALVTMASFLVTFVFDSSYGTSGILTILIIYLMKDQPVLALVCSTIVLSLLNFSFVELFAIPSALLVAMYNGKRGKGIKYFFYVFYPAHLLIFALLAKYLGNWIIVLK